MDECDCHFEDVLGPGYPLMRMATAHCPTHGDAAARGFVQIIPATGELLPAEERLQNVLKAIEDRIKEERAELDKEWETMFDAVFVDTSGFEKRRAFLSGLDIAWSIVKTESLKTDGSGPSVAPSGL